MSDAANQTKLNEAYGELSREEVQSLLFAQLIIQQSNMAMLLMGKSPHPQGGEMPRDLDGARLFIDQLEVLELKTKGNLTKEEENLLRQNLMSLRLAFVEAVESADKAEKAEKPESKTTPESSAQKETAPGAPGAADESESKKRFSKKFSL